MYHLFWASPKWFDNSVRKNECSVHNTGCKKYISQVMRLEVIWAKHMNITSWVPESFSKVLPYLQKFKEYSVKSSKLLIILYAITALALTMTIVIRLSQAIAKEKRQKPLQKPTDHEKEIITYSDCVCIEKDIPLIPSSSNKYFSLEPLQRTVSYPWSKRTNNEFIHSSKSLIHTSRHQIEPNRIRWQIINASRVRLQQPYRNQNIFIWWSTWL